MSRRKILLGTLGVAAVGTVGAFALRPGDNGAPHDGYFRALNDELKKTARCAPAWSSTWTAWTATSTA
jgi:hypothetical protein